MIADQTIMIQGKESKAGAGAAGAGTGTLMIAIATNLPPENELRPWLIFLSPTVSALFSILWIVIQVEIGNYGQNRKLKILVAQAKAHYNEVRNDPNASHEHKEELREYIEELERLIMLRKINQIRSLVPLKMTDFSAPRSGSASSD